MLVHKVPNIEHQVIEYYILLAILNSLVELFARNIISFWIGTCLNLIIVLSHSALIDRFANRKSYEPDYQINDEYFIFEAGFPESRFYASADCHLSAKDDKVPKVFMDTLDSNKLVCFPIHIDGLH